MNANRKPGTAEHPDEHPDRHPDEHPDRQPDEHPDRQPEAAANGRRPPLPRTDAVPRGGPFPPHVAAVLADADRAVQALAGGRHHRLYQTLRQSAEQLAPTDAFYVGFYREAFMFSDEFAFAFDEYSSISHLLRQCQIREAGLLNSDRFLDPKISWLCETEYRVVRCSKPVPGTMLPPLLQKQGYRPATLRETLCLLRDYPAVFEDHPHLIACGSPALRNPMPYPDIRRITTQRTLTYWAETQLMAPETDAIIVVKAQVGQ